MGGTIGYLVFFFLFVLLLSTLREGPLVFALVSLFDTFGVSFFFDRVHLASLTFHTFVLLHCSCSLHSLTLSKRSIFINPKF